MVPHKTRTALPPGTEPVPGHVAVDALASVPIAIVIVIVEADLRIAYRNARAREMIVEVDALDVALRGAEFLGRFDGWNREIAAVLASGVVRRFACALPPNAKSRTFQLLRGSIARLRAADVTNPRVVLCLESREPTESNAQQVEVTHRLVSLGKLASRVAHELNNPLDGILRYVNLALRTVGSAAEPKLTSYLTESRTGLMRMTQIIGDLLEFSRTTDGEFDDVPINDVIDQAIRAHAELAGEHHVVVAADFQTASTPAVRGGRLFQVLGNLIKNALDAMPDGGRLTLTSAVVGTDVIIRVTDTGPGLTHGPQEIFEPFFTTKEPGKGTGLGLAICRDFVEAMGGTIDAGTSSAGAVFTIRLPVTDCLPPSARRLPVSAPPQPESAT